MFAFFERLWPWPLIGILRVGPEAKRYGSKFRFAVVLVEKLRWPWLKRMVIAKDLVNKPDRCENCEWHEKYNRACLRAMTDLVDGWGFDHDWERIK